MKSLGNHLLTALLLSIVAGCLPICRAQDECFTAADITGSVLGTFFSTLAAIAIGFIVYWFYCRKRPDKPANLRPCDEDIEKHAYSNPFFQDDEPDKAATLESTENGKNDIGATKLTIASDKVPNNAASKGNKKAKPSRGNPFSVFTNSKVQHPQRALDDSCIHQEPERIEVCLRGSDFTGLGFNICGNIRDGIYVRDVLNRGPAGESGKIKAGDRIYNVTVSFEKITIEDALTILSYASPYDVILDVQKTSEQGGSFMPGHQKKGSMDSSTSGSLGSGGERLSHPIYRSQSSDDVSHIGNREVNSNSKRSLSVGVVPVRLKKDAPNKPNASSLQEQTIKEGNSQSSIDIEDSNQPQHSKEKVINVLTSSNHDEVQIMIHNEDKIKDGEYPSGHKIDEMLVKKSAHSSEPFLEMRKDARNAIDNSINSFTNPFKTSSKITEASSDRENKAQNINEDNIISTPDDLTNFVTDVSPSVTQNGSTPSVKVSVQTPDSTILDIDKIHLHFPDDVNNYTNVPNNGENKVNEKALFKIEHNSNSTNPFDVRVASHKVKQNNVDITNPVSADVFNDSMEIAGSIISKDLPESFLNSLQQNSPKELKINNKQPTNASASITDSLNDSLPDFDIFIPNLDLDDLQETLQATMIGDNDKNRVLTQENNKVKHLPENSSGPSTTTDVTGIPVKRRNQIEDIKRNGKVFTEDEINSHWQAIEGHIPVEPVADTVSLELVQEPSNIESFIDSLETPISKEDMNHQIAEIELAYQKSKDYPKTIQSVKTSSALRMNGRSHVVTTEDDDEITLDSLENTSAQASREIYDGKKHSKNTFPIENPAVSSKRKAPIATVQLPRVDIKIPTNIDFDSYQAKHKEDQRPPAKDKSMLNAVIIDSDLNENIEYFESKMQSVLQKSPKIKSKRSSVPGKRKAPLPPSQQQQSSTAMQQNDIQLKENSSNPFVVGLTPMSSKSVPEENPTYKSESVVFIQPNNVTTVQVNAPLEGFDLKDTQTSLTNNVVETIKTARKTSSKIDSNFGFGYLKTNFFEGLDKAGEEDLHSMSKEANRFHSIPRTGRSYEIRFNGKNANRKMRRSSSLGDLAKIKEVVAKSPPLERAVSMDLKGADDVLSGKFEELKMHVDTAEISQLDTSDEMVLSAHEITDRADDHLLNASTTEEPILRTAVKDFMPNHDNFNSHDTEFVDLTNSQDSPEIDKQTNKKFNILQGFFKKDKRKKKETPDLNVVQTAAAPVSPSLMIRTTASITIDNDHGNMNVHANTDSDQEIFVTDKEVTNEETLLHPNNFAKRQQSPSSSSLSEDSIDGERNCDSPPKRRMVAVDPSLKESFIYDSDSDENEPNEKKVIHLTTSETVNNFSSSAGMKVNNESHDEIWRGMTKESSSVTIPIIPPIITSKDVRTPTTSRKELDDQYQHLTKSYDGISEDSLRHSGPVRSLSPTKFPRPWSSGSENLEQSHEENGDSEKDHQERNSSELTSYHYTFNYNPSKSGNHIPQNDNLSVTTMHVTVSNNSSSSKNSIVSGEPFNAFPGVPQTNISKTVIISNSQLSLPMESSSDNSGPESPPPTLQPAE